MAGVPRAALVILAGTLATFHLPMEGVAVLLGVDAILDMARTAVNVLGNCLATAVVARWEGLQSRVGLPACPAAGGGKRNRLIGYIARSHPPAASCSTLE